MTKGSLQFVPEGWRVVPEEPTVEQIKKFKYLRDNYWVSPKEIISDVIKAAPQLTTPPVLRWESNNLMFVDNYIAWVVGLDMNSFKYETCIGIKRGGFRKTEQEARRAAEKALGIEFEVEEV